MKMVSHANTLQVGPYTIGGVSTGGVETSIHVKELGICFDMGVCPATHVSMNDVLISHGHPDHIGALPAYLGRRQLYGMNPARIFVDALLAPNLRDGIDAFGRLQGRPLPCSLVEVTPDEKVPLRNNLYLLPFRSAHVVPTTGYTVYEQRTKLKKEFLDLPGEEIARRRSAGETDLFYQTERALVTYPGDCLFETVLQRESLQKSKVLILECTFLDEQKGLDTARAGGHIHLDQICEHAESLKNEHIVLMHFSQLFNSAEVHQLMDKRLPPSLRERVQLLTRSPQQEEMQS